MLAYNGINDRRTRMHTFEELVPKQRGIDAKLARGIEKTMSGIGSKARTAMSQAPVLRMGGPL